MRWQMGGVGSQSKAMVSLHTRKWVRPQGEGRVDACVGTGIIGAIAADGGGGKDLTYLVDRGLRILQPKQDRS